MKNIKKLLITTLFISSLFGQNVNIKESTNSGDKLVIKLNQLAGNLKITGWDKKEVQISGEIDSDEDRPARLKRTDFGFRMQLKYSDNTEDDETIDSDLEVFVPRKYNLTIQTQGALELSNIEGEFQIHQANEDAEISNIKGIGKISIVNGTFDMEDSHFDGDLSNVNGELTVKNTDLFGYVRTVNAKMHLNRAPKGLEVSCVNGKITIDSAKDFVDANTTNASLVIGSLDGRLSFDSTNGSVTAKFIGNSTEGNHSIDIETLNGSADLTIPKDYSMSFDIRIRESNGRKSNDYELNSDFKEIRIESEKEGRKAVVITGKGKIANGKNKAKLRIINGDVTIRN